MAVDALNFHELRAIAKSRLPRGIFEYVDRGTEDETCIQHNHAALAQMRIAPGVLTSGAVRHQSIELFGEKYAAPFIVAPTAFTGLVWYEGEIALARAAARFGIPYCAATEAITSLERISAASPRPLWFQLYLWEEEMLWRALLDTAWANNVRTLVVTVDTPVFAKREFNVRNGFGIPFKFSAKSIADVMSHPRWTVGVLARYLVRGGFPNFANYPDDYRQGILGRKLSKTMRHEPNLSWEHVKTLRSAWKGNLVVKGILRVDDALKAASMGIDGIVVSNHGGRNLDSAVAPIDVLSDIADAVGDKLTIMADSGVRRGSDIFKLLASGAKSVLVGRAFLYGTAADGENGALYTATILADELDKTMAFSGCSDIRDIDNALRR
jgi:(S)-mandelate dehydrogenase